MGRNLVICCDGTNNQFGPENTSVIRLVQVLARDPTDQIVFYHPGVGTFPEPSLITRSRKKIAQWTDLAFATSLTRNVGRAYAHLMDFWEPGDAVFLFGFSRGAYTVRVLAGLLHALGLLPRGSHHLVPYVLRLYAAVRGKHRDDYWRLCNSFRRTFAREVPGGRLRRFPVHFLGVWDTVLSVGWVWDPVHFPYTTTNPSVRVVRHAVAIDERRWFFRQNLFRRARGQDLRELWFPGVHADIGGGYPEKESGLWRVPFQWMLDEARTAGLKIDAEALRRVLHRSTPSPAPWLDPQHESLRGAWWLAEFFPKLPWNPDFQRRLPEIGRGRHRFLHEGACLHESALRRIRDTDYSPPNMSAEFLAYVRRLKQVPPKLAYRRVPSAKASSRDDESLDSHELSDAAETTRPAQT